MTGLAEFDDAMETALSFMAEAANARGEAAKAAAWSNAELWLAEASIVLEESNR